MTVITPETISLLELLAAKSDMKSKHGAIIIKNGKIISTGHNHTMGSIKICINRHGQQTRLSRHAEEDALRNLNYHNLKDASMYVVRIGIQTQYTISKPCERCMASIRKMKRERGLRRVFYSVDTDSAGRPIWKEVDDYEQ